MKFNLSIFKTYDIRGEYPEQVNKFVGYFLGRSLVEYLRERGIKKPKILVGRDNRISSPSIFSALKDGIFSKNGEVFTVGLSTSPFLYWTCQKYEFDLGVQITASHLGKNYNGFKMLEKNGRFLGMGYGLERVKEIFEKEIKGKFKKLNKKPKKIDVLKEYIFFNVGKIDQRKIKNLKVVVDTGNGVSGILIKPLSQILKRIKFFHIFKKLDGNFPNHPPDPSKVENLVWLKKEVLKRKADLGIAFDGDADRIIFVDERGEKIPPDLIGLLIALDLLKKKEKILIDLRCSKILAEKIKEKGGEPIIFRAGHSFIKEKMRNENIAFGIEFSGHYYHRDHYFTEAPLIVFLKILEIISEKKKKISKIVGSFKKYYHSGEINFEIEKEPEKIFQKLKENYRKGKILEIDGLRIDFNDWWFLIRKSQTEPVLRLILEAKNKRLFEEKLKEIEKIIKSN